MEEGAFKRAWRDLRRLATRSRLFQLATALIVAANSITSALRFDGETAERVGIGLLGVPGMVLFVCLWTFGFLAATAPLRQRNEARAELRKLGGR